MWFIYIPNMRFVQAYFLSDIVHKSWASHKTQSCFFTSTLELTDDIFFYYNLHLAIVWTMVIERFDLPSCFAGSSLSTSGALRC